MIGAGLAARPAARRGQLRRDRGQRVGVGRLGCVRGLPGRGVAGRGLVLDPAAGGGGGEQQDKQRKRTAHVQSPLSSVVTQLKSVDNWGAKSLEAGAPVFLRRWGSARPRPRAGASGTSAGGCGAPPTRRARRAAIQGPRVTSDDHEAEPGRAQIVDRPLPRLAQREAVVEAGDELARAVVEHHRRRGEQSPAAPRGSSRSARIDCAQLLRLIVEPGALVGGDAALGEPRLDPRAARRSSSASAAAGRPGSRCRRRCR